MTAFLVRRGDKDTDALGGRVPSEKVESHLRAKEKGLRRNHLDLGLLVSRTGRK